MAFTKVFSNDKKSDERLGVEILYGNKISTPKPY